MIEPIKVKEGIILSKSGNPVGFFREKIKYSTNTIEPNNPFFSNRDSFDSFRNNRVIVDNTFDTLVDNISHSKNMARCETRPSLNLERVSFKKHKPAKKHRNRTKKRLSDSKKTKKHKISQKNNKTI